MFLYSICIPDFITRLRYLKYKISTKFHNLLFLFYFFSIFFLFHLFKLVPKLFNVLWCFIGRVRDFTNGIWKILKVPLKKIWICEFFFLNSAIYYLVFYFFIIVDILFSISSIWTCQQILEILILFYFMDKRFIKEFWKIMEYFSKKYRHLKSKILYKFQRLLFVFFFHFFSILVIFFSYFTYPNLLKNSKHFCGALLYGL